MFSQSDNLYKLSKITEIINDTIPSYRIDNLPKRLTQSLMEKTELSMEKFIDVLKAVKLY